MSVTSWMLFAVTLVLDVVGQLLFKHGVRPAKQRAAAGFWISTLTAWPVMAGVACYAVEAAFWIALLAREPLSLVFPLASLGYIGVVLASRCVLGERITARRWLGVATITAGVALITAGGA